MTDYFRKYGQAVADNGFHIIPIRPGYKAPLGLDWSSRVGDADEVRVWLDPKRGYTYDRWKDQATKLRETLTRQIDVYGIGVLTASTPAVDIDVYDEGVVTHMREFTEALLGKTIVRVGQPPKALMVYRTEAPFAKVNSGRYLDATGRAVKVEILGAGQQFVALAVHPDTKQPYRWLDKRAVSNTSRDSLPLITHDDARAIRDEFDRVAKARGWSLIEGSHSLPGSGGGTLATDDPFADVAPKVTGVSTEEMRRLTLLIPTHEDYDAWLQIGMALFHQFDGSDDGLAIWDEWSARGPNYENETCASKWPTFEIGGKGRAPLTARLILDRAKPYEEAELNARIDEAIERIMQAGTADELAKACKPYKQVAFSDVVRTQLVDKVRQRFKMLTGATLGIADGRKMLRYEDSERVERFDWLKGFVYVQFEDAFTNVTTGQTMTPKAFDATYSRELLTKVDLAEGKSTPDHLPQHVARNVAQIPIVSRRMYMPGLGDVFTIDGETYVNRFAAGSIPDAADTLDVAGRAAVATVEAHAVHQFGNARDRGRFLDFLAYIVQTQDRVSWAPFIQGVEGDGKTFWGDLMAAVLSMSNAGVIRGASLKEKFTGWAEGKLFMLIEEVRLAGEHRYDAVNNVKPYITNARVPIRRMQTDEYAIINKTSYVLTSNFKDGLPAGDSDRYFILFSRWQSREKLRAWKAENPSYYETLYSALDEAQSLRRWLLDRKLAADFNPRGRAPVSSDRREMAELVVDDETAAIQMMLAEAKDIDFCSTLLDSKLVSERFTGLGVAAPMGRRLNQLLSQAGLTKLGETGFGGVTRRWWSDEPERFQIFDEHGDTKINPRAIENWLNSEL